MHHSTVRLAAIVLALLIAVGGAGAGSAVGEAAAIPVVHQPAPAPGYTLEGFRWENRTQLDVYYNWDGGACTLDGTDFSGPASALDPAVAQQSLNASIADINLQLRGALTLVNAGLTTRADLCGENATRPIIVGYGALTSTGLTMFSGLQTPGAEFTTFTTARVFLDNAYDFTCPGASTYRDLQHVITHELLHALGVDHSEDPTAIMAATGSACELASMLQPDDIAALAALYPPVLPPPGTVALPTSVGAFDRAIANAGVNTALWSGGPVADLSVATLAASGVSVSVFANGAILAYVPGAPAFVNARFTAAFPATVPQGTIVLIVR